LQIVSYTESCGSESIFECETFVNINNACRPRSDDEFELSIEDDEAVPSRYEYERQRNIEERNRLFQ
jgi:hypothetical protein